MTEDRLIDIESKLAYQEVLIEKLQQALYDHHLTIEKMAKDMKNLSDKLEAFISPEIGPGNQKPPHY